MIDTHCHLLPRLDDGPRGLSSAVALARQLAEAGVTTVVCTPHFSRRYQAPQTIARARLHDLRSAVRAARVPLELQLAAEVSPGFMASAPPEELVARSIGGFLIVELKSDTPGPFILTALERLMQERLRPIFAHPERCAAAREQPRLLEEARASGALVQIVAPSLTRDRGTRIEEAAWRLLEAGAVDLLASDAHRPRPGGLHLERAIARVADRFGPRAVKQLTEHGPQRVVNAAAPMP